MKSLLQQSLEILDENYMVVLDKKMVPLDLASELLQKLEIDILNEHGKISTGSQSDFGSVPKSEAEIITVGTGSLEEEPTGNG